MILEKIRIATRQNHEELEADIFPIIKNISTPQEYSQLLKVFYGFYKPLQDQVDRVLDKEMLPDYPQRRKAEWILNDLHHMNLPADGIAVCDKIPHISTMAAAMGALYVQEGSTLGGRIICKTIASNLQWQDNSALTFFYGYGPEAGKKWNDFLKVLNQYTDTEDAPSVLGTANQVFLSFKDWIRTRYQ